MALYKLFSESHPEKEISILGIDLDPILIERANEKNDRPQSVTFQCLDFVSKECEGILASYLKEHGKVRLLVDFFLFNFFPFHILLHKIIFRTFTFCVYL